MTKIFCNVCKKCILNAEENISIQRECHDGWAQSIYFHVNCFEAVAGEEYIPRKYKPEEYVIPHPDDYNFDHSLPPPLNVPPILKDSYNRGQIFWDSAGDYHGPKESYIIADEPIKPKKAKKPRKKRTKGRKK
jgi:hypothetical protein